MEKEIKKMSRIESVVKALRMLKRGDMNTIAQQADKVYAEAGGKSNPREAVCVVRMVLPALLAWGRLIENNDGVYRLKRP